MFSDKFGRHSGELNPQWEAKQALEKSGRTVLDLTGSNPTSAGLDYPAQIPKLFDRSDILRYEPTSQGALETREAISEYYRSHGRTVLPKDLILTASTSEAYAFLFKLLCNPGDEVLIPSPTYPLFDTLAELENVELVRYPLRLMPEGNASQWRADFDYLRRQISTRCKALILVNPNNPTGHICAAEEIQAYLAFAEEYGLALIVDEVFCDYTFAGRKIIPLVSRGPLVFTLNGFSKILGLPQLKLGWIHVGGDPIAVDQALTHLEWIADAFLSVNTPVQRAARDLLALAEPIQSVIKPRLQANLEAAKSVCKDSRKLDYQQPEAGWYLVLDINTTLEDEAFALVLLKRHHVHVHPGSLFGFEDGCHLVLSLLGPESDFRQGMERILACAEETKDEALPA